MKKKRDRPLDLCLYSVHAVSGDLSSCFLNKGLTLLDLVSDKILAYQVYGKSSRVVGETFKMFAILSDSLQSSSEIEEESLLIWITLFLRTDGRQHTGRSVIVVWKKTTKKLEIYAQRMMSMLNIIG